MGTAVLASFLAKQYGAADAHDAASNHDSKKLNRKSGDMSRLESLGRYWSERTALVSSHHHHELAAAQSAVHQVCFELD